MTTAHRGRGQLVSIIYQVRENSYCKTLKTLIACIIMQKLTSSSVKPSLLSDSFPFRLSWQENENWSTSSLQDIYQVFKKENCNSEKFIYSPYHLDIQPFNHPSIQSSVRPSIHPLTNPLFLFYLISQFQFIFFTPKFVCSLISTFIKYILIHFSLYSFIHWLT